MVDIILADSPEELVKQVNQKIKEGWKVVSYAATPNWIEDYDGNGTKTVGSQYSCMIEK